MKKIPKDFGNAAVAHTYNMIDDGVYREVHEEIEANANKTEFSLMDNSIDAENDEKHKETGSKETEIPDFMKVE